MKLAGLSDLKVPNKAFDAYVRAQVLRWEDYITYANDGFGYLPYYCRVPVMTATDLYVWTGKQIRKDPHIVFKKKVKPHKIVAMLYLLKNIFGALRYA
jgi:phytoene synthase